jgi:hypothetical protein
MGGEHWHAQTHRPNDGQRHKAFVAHTRSTRVFRAISVKEDTISLVFWSMLCCGNPCTLYCCARAATRTKKTSAAWYFLFRQSPNVCPNQASAGLDWNDQDPHEGPTGR